MSSNLLYEEESYAIRGAIFEVYREMGCGFLEAVYHECLVREFSTQGVPFESKRCVRIAYKGEELAQTYQPDFVCYDKIIVELKAVREIDKAHKAQVFNYLRATGYRLGLLVNFGHHPKATVERIVL